MSRHAWRGFLAEAAAQGCGVHDVTGVAHICPSLPAGAILVEQRPQGLN